MGMTNAEAREHLKDILCDVPNDKCIDWIMALKQAIQVLEQQPCEDCISREEAIDIIYDYEYKKDMRKALEELPSVTPRNNLAETLQDCISRKAVINTIFYNSDNNCDVVLCTDLMDRIKDLPSVTPKTEWIPVNERLPEDYIHVLCQFYLGGMGECYLAHGAFHVVGGLVMTCNEVIAWMPLPESYKESDDVCKDCYYNDGEVHAECVICDKTESGKEKKL